ncbi:mitochondrial outer membrane protein SLC25A46-like [Physella acuta]|uniref:mitochondrial outer membrane protein SLC25A46-like n=1 Tax=Physella acuta TaxID=109671 RepID=UPI0027DC98D5|nr:mitochondrial outer membrane protein SLC25A46-like [Physella acuta]
MGTRVMNEFSYDSLSKRDGDENPISIRHDKDVENLFQDAQNTVPRQTGPDQVQKMAGLSIGFCSLFAEQLLSHPCIVMRRQCQVHHAGFWYHLTPISLLQTIINIQRTQGGVVLWKGLGSVYIVRGISMVSETVISEVTTLPREASRHSSIKKLGGHILLKGLIFAVTTPFYAASLVETIQSDIASEKPGVFDVLVEAAARVGAWGAPKTSRQVAVWHLALPTMVFRLSHYIVNSIAQFTVTSAMHLEQQEMRELPGGNGREPTAYETYFPELLATFTGGLLADMITYPLETVLHRLYVQGTRTIIDNTDNGLGVVPINTRYDGFIDCFRSIVAEEGLHGLYRGFGALVLQYSIHAIILRLAKFMFEKLSKELSKTKAKPKNLPGPGGRVRLSEYNYLEGDIKK